MKNTSIENQTRIIHGNTEIIIKELEEYVHKPKYKRNRKKVAIQVNYELYNFIVQHYGERGFSEFYRRAGKDLMERLKEEK